MQECRCAKPRGDGPQKKRNCVQATKNSFTCATMHLICQRHQKARHIYLQMRDATGWCLSCAYACALTAWGVPWRKRRGTGLFRREGVVFGGKPRVSPLLFLSVVCPARCDGTELRFDGQTGCRMNGRDTPTFYTRWNFVLEKALPCKEM